ncbi:MAG: hypothetical protein SGPRY_007587 [Prymnesium sp.]
MKALGEKIRDHAARLQRITETAVKKAQLLQREAMIAQKAMRRSPSKRREKVLKFTSSEAESEQAFLSYWATLSEQQARLAVNQSMMLERILQQSMDEAEKQTAELKKQANEDVIRAGIRARRESLSGGKMKACSAPPSLLAPSLLVTSIPYSSRLHLLAQEMADTIKQKEKELRVAQMKLEKLEMLTGVSADMEEDVGQMESLRVRLEKAEETIEEKTKSEDQLLAKVEALQRRLDEWQRSPTAKGRLAWTAKAAEMAQRKVIEDAAEVRTVVDLMVERVSAYTAGEMSMQEVIDSHKANILADAMTIESLQGDVASLNEAMRKCVAGCVSGLRQVEVEAEWQLDRSHAAVAARTEEMEARILRFRSQLALVKMACTPPPPPVVEVEPAGEGVSEGVEQVVSDDDTKTVTEEERNAVEEGGSHELSKGEEEEGGEEAAEEGGDEAERGEQPASSREEGANVVFDEQQECKQLSRAI